MTDGNNYYATVPTPVSPTSKRDMLGVEMRSAIQFDARTGEPYMYVFGYGSLIWMAGFEYTEKVKAVARGWARRFYHGNVTFRGTTTQPGRVVTIMEQTSAITPGVVFLLVGVQQISAAIKHLYYRECENGYNFESINVLLGDVDDGEQVANNEIHALTCIARPHNDHWLGEETAEQMADEIFSARGQAGLNRTYLYELAKHSRQLWPSFYDDHLFTLDDRVRELESKERA